MCIRDRDYGDVGLKWQKDKSWGNYYVTTLHEYSPVNLENALIHSDNIYSVSYTHLDVYKRQE